MQICPVVEVIASEVVNPLSPEVRKQRLKVHVLWSCGRDFLDNLYGPVQQKTSQNERVAEQLQTHSANRRAADRPLPLNLEGSIFTTNKNMTLYCCNKLTDLWAENRNRSRKAGWMDENSTPGSKGTERCIWLVLSVRSGFTADGHAHPQDILAPALRWQRQHMELDEPGILSSACHGEMPHTTPFYRKGLAFDAMSNSCQVRSTGLVVTGKPRPHWPNTAPPTGWGIRAQRGPQSVTHSLDRAWLFWNSSSGNVCSWFRFSRLQKRREEELETA